MDRRPRALTLIELLAALAVLGVGLAVSALAMLPLRDAPGSSVMLALAAARDSAVRAGHALCWRRDTLTVRFFPDGSSSGARLNVDGVTVVVDRLTGAVHAAR